MKNEITAKRLQQALSSASMTQQELADKCKINKASISQYINGSHAPSNISSGKIGEVLDVNPLWLMGYDVPMKAEFSAEMAETDVALSNMNKRMKEYALKLADLPIDKQEHIMQLIDMLSKDK